MNTVTMRHGDCFELMRGIKDGSFDSVITDPPEGLVAKILPHAIRIARRAVVILDPQQFIHEENPRNWEPTTPLPNGEVYYLVRHMTHIGIGRARVWGYGTGRTTSVFPMLCRTDIGDFAYHPGAKPIALWRELVMRYGGGSIFDPFAGIAGVGVAAKAAGKDFYGIEKNGAFYKLATERLGLKERVKA